MSFAATAVEGVNILHRLEYALGIGGIVLFVLLFLYLYLQARAQAKAQR